MFQGAESFNQPLNNWRLNMVVNLKYMFDGAISFDILENTYRSFF